MEKKRTYGVWAVRSSTSIFGPAQSWCKENGKPLEFDTKAAAENYAKEANEHTTANVRYYVKEKEPEPGAVRKGTSQPELDARSHEEVIPRNDAAEKQNEIPGRQIPSQTDPLVEIRSAVHSNYAGMVAMLGADNRVYLGREERCHYQNMQPSYYDNQDGSLCFVCDQPDMYYFLYGEGWAHTQAEMLERGLTLRQYEEFARLQNGVLAQFTTQREILFAGQPFQAPESYLRNAELYEEGQTGNYNMLDGRLNNEPPVRPDLTDGQTDEEIRELVPEAKPSLMDRLAVFDIEESGKQIGEKLFLHLNEEQKNALMQYILEQGVCHGTVFNSCHTFSAAEKNPLTEIQEGELYLCLEHRTVRVRERIINLTSKEFDILTLLIANPKRVFTYELITDLVWKEDCDFYSRKAIHNHISKLRKKLRFEPDLPNYIESVAGIGYKFEHL